MPFLLRLPIALWALVILAGVALIYLPVLGFDYVWDDLALFVNSPALRDVSDWSAWWSGVSNPILPGTTYFRPLVLSTFVVEFRGDQTDPMLSHAVNLIIYVANVAMVGYIAYGLLPRGDRPMRVFGVVVALAVYGFHPANMEAVAWVSGRFDLMVTFFGLLLLVADWRLTGVLRFSVIGIAYFFAATSKEMAVVIPLAYLCVRSLRQAAVVLPGESAVPASRFGFLDKDLLTGLVAIGLAGAGYLVLRINAMPEILHIDQRLAYELTGWEHLVYVLRALWFYMRTMVWPFVDVAPQHPLAPSDLVFLDVVKATVAACVAAGLAFLALRGRFFPPVALLLVAIFSLMPVLHIIPLTVGGNIGHERFLAWPLCFFALAVSYAIVLSASRGVQAVKYALGGVVLWCFLAISNNAVTLPLWRSEVTLWGWAYKQHPNSGYVQSSFVGALFRSGNLSDAQRIAREVLATTGRDAPLDVLLYMAQIDLALGRSEDGLRRLLSVSSEIDSVAWQGRFIVQGGTEAKVKGVRRHVDVLLSGAYLAVDDPPAALAYARRAAYQDPASPNAYLSLARAAYAADRWAEAEAAFEKGLVGVSSKDKAGPAALRRNFLNDRCSTHPQAMKSVCYTWRTEQRNATERDVALP